MTESSRYASTRRSIRSELMKLAENHPTFVLNRAEYELKGQVGRGGFGAVNLAINTRTGKMVAIKQLFDEKLEKRKLRRVVNEIITMFSCNYYFLVNFVGFTIEAPYWIATEYVPNGSLSDVLHKKNNVRLSPTQKTKIAIGIAAGMAHLHRCGIVHRDLKPANILLDKDYLPHICDFGVSRYRSEDDLMTKTIGTYYYMAPEQITSDAYTEKVDVFAYGMVLYELCEGRMPFKHMKPVEAGESVIRGDRPEFNHTQRDLQILISDCWSENPDDRPTFEAVLALFKARRLMISGSKPKELRSFFSFIDSVKTEIIKVVPPSSRRRSDPPEETPRTVMGDYTNPKFPRYLRKFVDNLKVPHFHDFYSVVAAHFTEEAPPEVQLFILDAFCGLVKRNQDFLSALWGEGFFDQLHITHPMLIDHICNLWGYVFIFYPQFISEQHVPLVEQLLQYRPRKLLILLSYYVKSFTGARIQFIITDILYAQNTKFFDSANGGRYLTILFYLTKLHKVYRDNRANEVQTILVNYLLSPVKSTVSTAITYISYLHELTWTIPESVLKKIIPINPYAITLLLRIPGIKITGSIVNSILASASHPLAGIALMAAARQPKVSEYLARKEFWIENAYPTYVDTYKVFLIIFQHHDQRDIIAMRMGFPSLLKSLADLQDIQLMSTFASILHRITITSDFLARLDDSGFLKAFFTHAISFKDNVDVCNSCLVSLDTLMRAGYSPSYHIYLPQVIELMSDSRLCDKAIFVMVMYSSFQQFKAELTPYLQYFQSLQSYPQYQGFASRFVENVSAMS